MPETLSISNLSHLSALPVSVLCVFALARLVESFSELLKSFSELVGVIKTSDGKN